MAAPVRGERRVVTVLFCDVKGSTTIAERLDPEEWAEIMSEAFAHLIPPIERYEGLVARLMGDAVLAFFGAPVAHEDDPELAVRAGLDILAAVGPYRDRLRAERGISEFDVRIGINTGVAVLGDVGSGASTEYTALGDAVNVAARVQAAAEPGQILLADATARLVEGSVELEPLGAFEVKGRSTPVRMHRVVGLRKAAAPAGLRRALVGRAGEVAGLEQAGAAVREGDGRVVGLVGDAGLGKTRLLEELRLREPDLQWYEARARSYGGSTPFLVFRDHLRAWSGVREGDPLDQVRAKLAAAVGEVLGADAAPVIPVVELVAGVSSGDVTAVAGEQLRKEIVRVVTLLAKRQAAKGPMVIAVDDLQWSDAASADLVGELLELTDEIPLLMLLAFRPERTSVAWRVKQRIESDYHHRYTEIALAPLASDEAMHLLDELTGGAPIAPRVRSGILEKAEGNPLFIEQFARAVIAGEVSGSDVALPDSLVSLLASRLDRLEERQRRVLQAASVIGRTFAQPLLRVLSDDDALDRDLVELQRADLIREEQRVPHRAYSFRHALLQEVAYSSLLQRRRRELHASVAAALDSEHRVDEGGAALIGHHYAEAGDPRGLTHLRDAARRALRLHALEDALALCDRALALARRLGVYDGSVCDVYGDRGRVLELRGDWDGALATYDEMETVGRERADRAMVVRAQSHRITIYATPTARGDLGKARELVDVAIPEARALAERSVLAQLLLSAMHAYAWSHQEEKAREAGDEALAIARELGLKEVEAFASLDVSRYARFQKGWRGALEAVRRAAVLFEELGNKPMLADALSTLAIGEMSVGRYDEALRLSGEALALAERIENLWNRSFSRFATPYVRFDRGDWGTAIAEWEDAIRLGVEAGFVAVRLGPSVDLAYVYECSGDRERADALLNTAAAINRDHEKEMAQGGWTHWLHGVRARVLVGRGDLAGAANELADARAGASRAAMPSGVAAAWCAATELALAQGSPEDAVREAREGVASIDRYGYVPMTDELQWLEGEAHRAAGRMAEARAAYDRARASGDALGAVRTRWRILVSLAEMAEHEGDASAAARLRDEAAVIVRGIEASLRPAGLDQRFAALPRVRALLARATLAS